MKNILTLLFQSWRYYAITIFSYALSFISIPIFISCLGINKYGNFELYLSISFLIAALIDLGLTNYAIRESIKQVFSDSVMFWNITIIKSLLLFLLLIVFTLIINLNFFGQYDYRLLFLSLLLGFSRSLIPVWYFQAKELIGAWGVSIAISQVASILITFFCVYKNIDILVDYLLIINIVINFSIYLFFFFRINDINESKAINLASIKQVIKASTSLAPAAVFSTIYTYGGNLLVATFAGSENLGTYALADRLHKSIIGVLGPLTQSYYPRIIQLIKIDYNSAKILMKEIRNLFLVLSITIISFIWLFGDIVVKKFSGPHYSQNTTIFLKFLSIHILITALSRVYGYLWLVPNHEDKKFSSSVLLGSIIYIISSILLGPYFKIYGVITSFLLAEIMILILLIYYTKIIKSKS